MEHYRRLDELTADTYHYANSMQTAQRRIPIGGDDGNNKTWEELLPHYELELKNFKENLQMLKESSDGVEETEVAVIEPHQVTVLNPKANWATLTKGTQLISGIESVLNEVAPELQDMKVLKRDATSMRENGSIIEFETAEPVKLLVGYFRSDQRMYAKAPTLETDASANLYGQADPVL